MIGNANWSDQTQKYANRFISEVVQPKALQLSQEMTAGRNKVASGYDQTNVKQTDSGLRLESKGEIEQIRSQGHYTVQPVQHKGVKHQVNQNLDTASAKVKNRHDENTGKGGTLKDQVDTQYDRFLFGAALDKRIQKDTNLAPKKTYSKHNLDMTKEVMRQEREALKKSWVGLSLKNLMPFQGMPPRKVKG